MTTTFIPKEDDTFATATQLVEIATVKPSGYLMVRAVAPAEALPAVTAAVEQYYAEQGRTAPIIYTRAIGTSEWTAAVDDTIVIPDELPEDFK